MEIWQSIILGITQGLTEFLPVSSSGHLVLVQNAMGLADIPIMYDVMFHLGTLVAVVLVMYREIAAIFAHPVKNHLVVLIIATIPAAVVGFLFNDLFEEAFSGTFLGICFILTAVILMLGEFIYDRHKTKYDISLYSGISMGLMQALALFPGISRSGSTIAGGLFFGVNGTKAANFAFLMSIPIILGSLASEVLKLKDTGFGDIDMAPMAVGTVVAAVAGFFAVKFMLKLIKERKLTGFAIYVTALGIFVLIDQNISHLIFK